MDAEMLLMSNIYQKNKERKEKCNLSFKRCQFVHHDLELAGGLCHPFQVLAKQVNYNHGCHQRQRTESKPSKGTNCVLWTVWANSTSHCSLCPHM